MKYLMLACVLIAGTARADFYVKGSLALLYTHDDTETLTVVNNYYRDERDFPIMTSYSEQRISRNIYDRATVKNPLGTFALGYDWTFKRFSVEAEIAHDSFPLAGDRGEEKLQLAVKWYPFR